MQFGQVLQQVQIGERFTKVYVPDETVLRQAYDAEQISFPYWGKLWPAAKALAQWLHEHPETIKNKNVLELGAGLGLPSLVAAQCATSIVCTDADANAMEYVQASAKHLGCTNLSTAVLDWQQIPEGLETDVVLLSDVNYNPDAFPALLQTIQFFIESKAIVVLSTPQRLMAKPFVERLSKYVVKQQPLFMDNTSMTILLMQ